MNPFEINRRDVLKSLAAMTAAVMVPTALTRLTSGQAATPAATPARDRLGDLLPLRKLGRSGAQVTLLGLGGAHLGRMPDAAAQQTIEAALAGGVRFFDTAHTYNSGRSEELLGRHLTPKYRDLSFIASKTLAADAASARKQLDQSLSRLKTDYLDLWQMHELMSPAMVDHRLAGGILDVFLEAQARGKVRHLGFTGHATPDSHLHMLDRMQPLSDPLASCQMPVNVADPACRSFILRVLPTALARGYGICAVRSLADGGFTLRGTSSHVAPTLVSAEEALHFIWSLPVSTLITGPDTPAQFAHAIACAQRFETLDAPTRKTLVAKAAPAAGVEYYKA